MKEQSKSRREGRVTLKVAALVCLLVLLGTGADRGLAEDDESEGWHSFRARPEALDELVDCRSPAIPHEEKVEFGEEWEIDDHALIITSSRGRLEVAHREPDEEEFDRARRLKKGAYEIEAFGVDYGLSIRQDQAGSCAYIASAYGMPIRVGSDTAFVVDSNLDGELSNDGDGLVARNSKTVGPFVGEVWTNSAAIRIRCRDGEWEIQEIAMPHERENDLNAAWRLLQWRRQQCGVPPMEYDAAKEPAMLAHCEYLEANNTLSCDETPGLPGYTVAGRAAGLSSIVTGDKSSHVAATEACLGTLYYRMKLLTAGLARSALKLYRGYFMVDVLSDDTGPFLHADTASPPHGATSVQSAFYAYGETPMPAPVRPDQASQLGTAIAFNDRDWEFSTLRPDDVSLTVIGPRGEVGGILAYPGRPPQTGVENHNCGCISLTPDEPLASGVYTCRVEYTNNGEAHEYEWSFAVGR